MTKIIQRLSRVAIGEQFGYPPNLVVYLDYSDINGLSEIAGGTNIKKHEVKRHGRKI